MKLCWAALRRVLLDATTIGLCTCFLIFRDHPPYQ
jgi:hypothetical protein